MEKTRERDGEEEERKAERLGHAQARKVRKREADGEMLDDCVLLGRTQAH